MVKDVLKSKILKSKVAKYVLKLKVTHKVFDFLRMLHWKKRTVYERQSNMYRQNYLRDFSVIKNRESLFKSSNINLDKKQKKIVSELALKGLFVGNLKDYYRNHKALIDYMVGMSKNTENKGLDELRLEHHQEQPGGPTINYNNNKPYWANLYHSVVGVSDPIKEFMTDPNIFLMAAKYLGEIPQIMMCDFLYTPATNITKLTDSMLWHIDASHRNDFRIFINPFDIGLDNGPTMAFPNKYTKEWYDKSHRVSDEQMKSSGVDFNEITHIVGKSGTMGIVDTCTNFHCGSRSTKPRYLALLTFFPHVSFKDMKEPFVDKSYEKENKVILDWFKNNSLSD